MSQQPPLGKRTTLLKDPLGQERHVGLLCVIFGQTETCRPSPVAAGTKDHKPGA